jgi:glutamine synthetase
MNSRFDAVEKAFAHEPLFVQPPAKATSEYYGCKVFNRNQMRKYLSRDTRKLIYDSIDAGAVLNPDVAEHAAAGMKQWAMDMGVTHYTHWFQPLTGGTAEKHDSFAEPYGNGGTLEEFTGKVLTQQEPDASSFPSGGLRNTFEARGYTAWDPSSPAFIIGDTLCIPTVFISYTGEALDIKTPLLRSIAAVNTAATALAKYFDDKVTRVFSYLGWEQEYFLVDKELYELRPDLVMTERTLMGHTSAKNQQLDDHYFGSIPQRVLAFMQDLEIEAYKLGIPVKTRHNEVAPNQFELAPVYEEANLAVDHNLIIMSLMRTIAERHGFKVLLHEKPFKGINGSGKHCNWSLGTDTGVDLIAPGKTDEETLRFMSFMSVILMAVYKNNGLLKASVVSASNAHRLGANEAPPAIISSFLGSQVTKAFDALLESGGVSKMGAKSGLNLGIPQIPELLVDNTDRNRTSPFAFTGNRFEFRAVGSSANCGLPISVLNTVVAYQLVEFKKEVDKRMKAGTAKDQAILSVVRDYYAECKNVCFDGNGYSDEWKAEAKRRGLDCETSVPVVFDIFTSKQTEKVYTAMKVLTPVELKARNEVNWENYCKKIEIEARVLSDMSLNHIVPVATQYQSVLLDNVSRMKSVFTVAEFKKLAGAQIDAIAEISEHISNIRNMCVQLDETCDKLNKVEGLRKRAVGYHDDVLPMMIKIRGHVDDLEMIVDDQMWPLPKYRELLFIR